MQTSTVFMVIDFGFDKNTMPKICGVFNDFSSALSHANELRQQYGEDLKLDIVPSYMMIGNKKGPECESFDYRKHIAFDVSQMEIPIKCDLCENNATHFCNIHGGIYCFRHKTNHEDMMLSFSKEKKSK